MADPTKLSEAHRQEIIGMLLVWTNWNVEALEKLADSQLLTEFDRRVGK